MKVYFNATINYDNLTFNGGDTKEVTQDQLNHLQTLDVNGLPYDRNNPNSMPLITLAGDTKPAPKDK